MEINVKKVKNNFLNPQYKEISKPEFWLYENFGEILPKILTVELENHLWREFL